ncbi:Glu/Leu/Phe/Val dehydrogenase [Patescibacteria group bacterium]|nr:Glu/Leu/Phe/Val dehydrogenase [Patescibacteria group bacterium]
MSNPFENALNQISRAAAVRDFPPEFLAKLKTPNNILEKKLTITLDNGEEKTFDAYRVQFNNARGPYKGGIRYHQQTDLAEVKALAFWMALKTAVVNIPMGGGKGGITVNPKELSVGELERLSRAWTQAFAEFIGPQKDVPAPDVNTTPQIMAWIADEYGKITGDTSGAVVTGKPIENGGSEGRGTATAQGGYYVFEALKEKLGLPDQCRVVIQGVGNAGRYAARLWSAAGHKVIAISDSKAAVYDPNGLNVEEVIACKDKERSLEKCPNAEIITNAELLELDCDLLIPAALENQITQENAANLKARVVLELANGPTTPEADDILFSRGIAVVPDILANAGGVTVSTFEWEQNLKNEHWSEQEVFDKLKEIMVREAENIYAKSKELNTDLRRAAFIVALERIEGAMK